MEIVIITLQAIILLAVLGLFLLKNSWLSYSAEKGKNLATKEDVAGLTRKIEEVKIEYTAQIERLKFDLSLLSRKHSLLLDEKIRVFKRLQNRLVRFKRYCEAAEGSLLRESEFSPHLDSLSSEVERAVLAHLTDLHEIQQEDFIFLSDTSKALLSSLHANCSMMCSMELAIFGADPDERLFEGAASMYGAAIKDINGCLQSLYDELEFPSTQKQNLENSAPTLLPA